MIISPRIFHTDMTLLFSRTFYHLACLSNEYVAKVILPFTFALILTLDRAPRRYKFVLPETRPR